LLVVGCWLLVVGCWLLVVGCWLLVVGCWLLVVGCWLFCSLFFVEKPLPEDASPNPIAAWPGGPAQPLPLA